MWKYVVLTVGLATLGFACAWAVAQTVSPAAAPTTPVRSTPPGPAAAQSVRLIDSKTVHVGAFWSPSSLPALVVPKPKVTSPPPTTPTYTAPAYTAPAYTTPAYTAPTYTAPAYTAPAATTPAPTPTKPKWKVIVR